MQAPFRHTLLYDGECPICLASVRKLRGMDRIDRLEYLPNQASAVEERFPQIPPEALAGSLHLVGPEGEVWEGAEAVERIVTLLPGYTWLSWLFGLPFARPLARAAYRTIARSRYRLSCTQHCSRGSLPDV